MPQLVCVKCRYQLEVIKTGISVLHLSDFGPDKLYEADVWECPKCTMRIVTGFGDCYAEHYEDHFPRELNRAQSRKGYIEYRGYHEP
jgi:hypothetical protein